MKSILLTVFFILSIPFITKAQYEESMTGKVEVIQEYDNLFRYQNFYLSGQPSMDALEWLKSEGVTRIINLRTEEENQTFRREAFDEEAVSHQLGFSYDNLPVNGLPDYNPEKLQELEKVLNGDEKILTWVVLLCAVMHPLNI